MWLRTYRSPRRRPRSRVVPAAPRAAPPLPAPPGAEPPTRDEAARQRARGREWGGGAGAASAVPGAVSAGVPRVPVQGGHAWREGCSAREGREQNPASRGEGRVWEWSLPGCVGALAGVSVPWREGHSSSQRPSSPRPPDADSSSGPQVVCPCPLLCDRGALLRWGFPDFWWLG